MFTMRPIFFLIRLCFGVFYYLMQMQKKDINKPSVNIELFDYNQMIHALHTLDNVV